MYFVIEKKDLYSTVHRYQKAEHTRVLEMLSRAVEEPDRYTVTWCSPAALPEYYRMAIDLDGHQRGQMGLKYTPAFELFMDFILDSHRSAPYCHPLNTVFEVPFGNPDSIIFIN